MLFNFFAVSFMVFVLLNYRLHNLEVMFVICWFLNLVVVNWHKYLIAFHISF